jgi:hypothetical protein
MQVLVQTAVQIAATPVLILAEMAVADLTLMWDSNLE